MSEYHLAASQVLTDFQFIEETLRMYIDRAYITIRECTQGKLPFKLDHKSLEKDSLGKLIDKYEHLNDNDSLVARLRKVVPERNHVAHESLLLTSDELQSERFIKTKVGEFEKLHEKLKPLVKEMVSEIKKLEARAKQG